MTRLNTGGGQFSSGQTKPVVQFQLQQIQIVQRTPLDPMDNSAAHKAINAAITIFHGTGIKDKVFYCNTVLEFSFSSPVI